jgi:hypothetical protein
VLFARRGMRFGPRSGKRAGDVVQRLQDVLAHRAEAEVPLREEGQDVSD